MATAFDDLIPTKARGAFDDLIPSSRGAFDDLIPRDTTPPTIGALPNRSELDESSNEGMNIAPGEAPLQQLPWTQVPVGQSLHALTETLNKPTQAIAEKFSNRPNESLIGINPEDANIPNLHPAAMPVASALKAVGGVGQFMTSPKGLIEMTAAATPAAPVVIGKWTLDMLDGLNRSIHDAIEAYQKGDKQAVSDAAANTALFGLGIAGAARAIRGGVEPAKPSESVQGGIDLPTSDQSAAPIESERNLAVPEHTAGAISAPLEANALENIVKELQGEIARNQIVKSEAPKEEPAGKGPKPSPPVEASQPQQPAVKPLPIESVKPETPPATPGEVVAKAVEEQPLTLPKGETAAEPYVGKRIEWQTPSGAIRRGRIIGKSQARLQEGDFHGFDVMEEGSTDLADRPEWEYPNAAIPGYENAPAFVPFEWVKRVLHEEKPTKETPFSDLIPENKVPPGVFDLTPEQEAELVEREELGGIQARPPEPPKAPVPTEVVPSSGSSDQGLHDAISKAFSSAMESLKAEGWTFDPQWGPLELVLNKHDLGQWMFMGKHPNPYAPGKSLYEYKNGITRRYLRLDDEGMAYGYRGGYEGPDARQRYPMLPLQDAIDRAYEGLSDMGHTRHTDYNREFIEARNKALLKAGFGVSRATPEGTLTSMPAKQNAPSAEGATPETLETREALTSAPAENVTPAVTKESGAETPAMPEWVRQEMQARGLDPNRPLNDIDLHNASVVEAVKSDPTLSEEQRQRLLKTGSHLTPEEQAAEQEKLAQELGQEEKPQFPKTNEEVKADLAQKLEKRDKVEELLDRAIEATDPGQQLGGSQVSLGLARLPVWLTKQVAHDALKVVRAAYRTSKDVLSAIQRGIDHIRQFNLPGFNEEQARRWLRSGLPEKEGPRALVTLDKITDYLRSHDIDSPKATAGERIKAAYDSVKATIGAAGDTAKLAWARSAAMFNSLVELYRRPVPTGSDFRNAVKLWHAMDTRTLYQAYQFAKELRSKVPNAIRRAAMTVYLQAGGDHATLEFQHGNIPDKYKPIWKAAMELTPDEMEIADQIKADWQDKLKKGVAAGIVDHAQQNYAPQTWKKAPEVDPSLDPKNPGSPFGKLDTRKPFFYYEKSVPNYYEGIMAKGVPRSLDVADLVGYYQAAFNKAVSSRAVVRLLADGKAADGRPVTILSGRAEAVPNETAGEDYLVNPKYKATAVTADGRPYQVVDHPALQDWKWVNKTEQGDILMKGEMLVHPDHAQFLKNVLRESALREGTLGKVLKPVFKLNAFLKSSKFAFAPFHIVTEGEHALSHLVNPVITKADVIDFRDPVQARLVRGGLDLGMNDAYSLFSEGMGSHGGLFRAVPGLGKLAAAMSNWTFRDYIPQLKMKVGKVILERNLKRYAGKLSLDEIDELSASQTNNAFGGQNYRLLGRNPTTMDILRIGLLAPDFFVSRAKVLGQALKPYNAEQRRMLFTQVAAVYIGARILNGILDDDNDPHWDDPFAVYHGGRRYSIRTISGDLVNFAKDWKSFSYGRMAPLMHLGVEMATGRDWRGIKRTTLEQVTDFLRWALPVGVEGVIPGEGHPETTLTSAALQAVGVGSRQATAFQRTKELAREFNRNSPDPAVRKQQDRDDRESHMSSDYKRLDNALMSGDYELAKKEYQKLIDEGRKPEVIARRYSHEQGFTGSKARDQQFIATLTPQQRAMLERAKAEKVDLYRRFLRVSP